MRTNFCILSALVAGFLGGLASRYIIPAPVHAQAPAVPEEVRAKKFVLVDEKGVARGVFGIERGGVPVVEIMDSKGRVWEARFQRPPSSLFPDVPQHPGTPALLPIPK